MKRTQPIFSAAAKRPRIFYGWYLAWAYSGLNFYWGGTLLAGFTALFNPIKDAFGLSSTGVTTAVSIRQATAVVGSPIVGAVFDRIGARALMLVATAFAAGGTLMLALAHHAWEFYVASFISSVGIAIFVAGTGPALMANWFVRNRGKAVGICLAGSGVAGFLIPVLVLLIDAIGWRDTVYVILGGLLAVSIPLSLILRHRPEQYGLRPDGDQPDSARGLSNVEGQPETSAPGAQRADGSTERPGTTLRLAMRTPAFWLIAFAFSLTAFGNSAAGLFFIPHLTQEGFSRSQAAWTLTAVNIVGVGATFGAGWLSDMFDRRAVVGLSFFLQGAGLVSFAFASSIWHLVPFVALFGFGSRSIFPVISPLLADYFGLRNFGKIQGVVFSVFILGGIAGSQIAAAVEDASGSYTYAFAGYSGASLAAIALMAMVRKPAAVLP